MAKEKVMQTKIQDTEESGFGDYQESTGGGHPFKAGDSNTRTTRANGKLREQENDTKQPRDKYGHFTYKSVNGKAIDPKYGPSRGKTVNPLLTGGDGTIKIDDVKGQFAAKSGAYWDKYKDKWYQKGSELVLTDMKTKVSGKDIWDVGKERYDTVKGEFTGESSVFSSKSGKSSQEEKAAKSEVAKTGKQAYVYNPDKSIKKYVKKGEMPVEAPKAPEMPAPQPAPAPAPAVETPKAPEPAPYVSEFTPEQIDMVAQFFKNQIKPDGAQNATWQHNLDKFNASSPEAKDKYIKGIIDKLKKAGKDPKKILGF